MEDFKVVDTVMVSSNIVELIYDKGDEQQARTLWINLETGTIVPPEEMLRPKESEHKNLKDAFYKFLTSNM